MYYYSNLKDLIYIMECISCKGINFFKHFSGYLVCERCSTQVSAPELKLDDFQIVSTPLKKRIKLRMRKAIKQEKQCK